MGDKINALLTGEELDLVLLDKSRKILRGDIDEKEKDDKEKDDKEKDDKEKVSELHYETKDQALSIIYDGYTSIPKIYHEVFLDPFKKLVQTYDYALIQKALGEQLLLYDLFSCIHQRSTQDLDASHAFEETVSDLYDGYLSNIERSGIKAPDYQAFSPLVIWGKPEAGPYTWPANFGSKLDLQISLVSMPPAYKRNVALWAAIGHEVGGHDILRADIGLLPELGNVVEAKLIEHKNCKHKNCTKLREPVAINGRKDYSLAEFAAQYWRHRIDETASDVCGILNLGPASGFGLALILLSLRKYKLHNSLPAQEAHPFDPLRIILAADVIRGIRALDFQTCNAYADALEYVVRKYGSEAINEGFNLYTMTKNGDYYLEATIPYEGMRETVKIVADVISSTRFKSLEYHSLSEINTWTNSDEILVQRIVNDLLIKNEPPDIQTGPDDQIVYAAHLLAGGIIALMKNGEIEAVSENTIKSLVKLYENNPVWKGFPTHFRGDVYLHSLVPGYKDSIKGQGPVDSRTDER
jgi:hypothetical protein